MRTQKHDSKPEKIFPVFQKLGLDAMIRVYRSNMRFFSYRWKQYLWQGLTGIRFHHFLSQVNVGVKDLSHTPMAESAWNVLKRLAFSISVDRQIELEQLKDHPVIFYARHPGYIEPMACFAALKEFNPKVVATAWTKNLSAHVSQQIISVPDSRDATMRDIKKYKGMRRIFETIWAHILIFQVIKYLQGDIPADECRQQRQSAIAAILSALGRQESILLFPSGGDGQKPWVREHTAYFEKFIRIIITRQKRIPALEQVCFVPVIIRSSLRALFKSNIMIPWHPFTFLFRMLPDRPFQFIIREHIPLKELLKETKDSKKIVRYLMQRLV